MPSLVPCGAAVAQDPDLDGMPGLPGAPDAEAASSSEDDDLDGMPGLPDAAGGRAGDGDLTDMPPPSDSGSSDGFGGVGTGFSPEIRFGGRWSTRIEADLQHDRDGEDIAESRNRLELELAARMSPTFSALVAGRMTHDAKTPAMDFDGARYGYEAELREAYFTWRGGATTISGGNQVIRWGTTEAFSPNDEINGSDYRDGLAADLETPRIPRLALRAQQSFDRVTLEAVWLPFFQPHRANLLGSDWAPVPDDPQIARLATTFGTFFGPEVEEDVQALLVSSAPPDESPKNSGVGARASLRGDGWDLRLNALYDWHRIPKVSLGGLAPESEYIRKLVLGLDGAYAVEDFVFKVDASWQPAGVFYADDFEAFEAMFVYWAGGVDYMPDTDLNITVEAYGLSILEDPPEGKSLIFIEQHWANVLALVRWSLLDEDLVLQLGVQYGITNEDFVISPSVAWSVAEGHDLSVGGTILEGPELSPGGIFDHNDLAWVRYDLAF